MSDHESEAITIALSPTQVDDVVRAAARGRAPSISTLIADSFSEPLSSESSTRPARVSKQASAKRAA